MYQATFRRVAARNAEYFASYPEDRAAVSRIARHLRGTEEYLPDGERLTVERFQMVGSFLGGNTRVDALHHLLEDAFVDTPGGERLSDAFLEQVRGIVSRAANPLYALMHESIYGQGGATDWAARRVLQDFPEFSPDAAEPLLTGEMVYPWYFEQDAALRPLRNVARLLAGKPDWKPLYDPERLASNSVPVAAAVYSEDIYVDRDLSLETASAVRGLQVWETSDFHHDGIADDGEGIFGAAAGNGALSPQLSGRRPRRTASPFRLLPWRQEGDDRSGKNNHSNQAACQVEPRVTGPAEDEAREGAAHRTGRAHQHVRNALDHNAVLLAHAFGQERGSGDGGGGPPEPQKHQPHGHRDG